MSSEFYDVQRRKVFSLTAGTSRYNHTFGGPPQHEGVTPRGGKVPLHLLYMLDLADPAVGLNLPGLTRLPLYYGFVYGGSAVSYRLVSDTKIRILEMNTPKAEEDFPYRDYPRQFGQRTVRLRKLPFNAKKPADIMKYSGIFGFDWIPEKERPQVYDFLVRDYHRFRSDRGKPPESLAAMTSFYYSPFVQGPHELPCPNRRCRNHRGPGKMNVLALVLNDPVRGVALWGDDNWDVFVFFFICPRCPAIYATNECT